MRSDWPSRRRLNMPRIARLAVAGLATRLGFSYDEVEDLRIAVGEACSILMSELPAGRLMVVYRLEPDAMEIEATADTDVSPPANGGLTDQILTAVVDDHRIDRSGRMVWLRKRATPRIEKHLTMALDQAERDRLRERFVDYRRTGERAIRDRAHRVPSAARRASRSEVRQPRGRAR